MPIHAAMSSRFPLLEGVPSIQALMEDPQYAQARAEFESHPGYQPPDVSVRPDAAPGPHGPVPVRVYNDGAGAGSRPGLVWMHGGAWQWPTGDGRRAGWAEIHRRRRRDLVSAANPIDAWPRIVGRQVGLIPGA